MEEEVRDRLLVRLGHVAGHRMGVDLVQVDVHPGAGLQQVHRQQGQGQGRGGHRFEIDQRLDRHTADPAHVVHARHAVHHGAEDHRADDRAHQGDEAVAERLHLGAEARIQPAKQPAGDHAGQHLEPELLEKAHGHPTRWIEPLHPKLGLGAS